MPDTTPAATAPHYVIIGVGVSGSQAAAELRDHDRTARITIITASRLPFYQRYDLPRVFNGVHDWRTFMVHQPGYYSDNRITLRRDTRVGGIDAKNRLLHLTHKETVHYDKLLVASGGRPYVPEHLVDYRRLMFGWGSFEDAMAVRQALPDGGHALLLGGDMIGLDLARTLIATGHRVTLVAGEHSFWPHQVPATERPKYLAALQALGLELLEEGDLGGIVAVEQSVAGLPARRVVFGDGSDLHGDVVMPFFGLAPQVEFMAGAGPDIERGLLVQRSLRTTDEHIYAAGNVCQIWSEKDRRYKFYNGWKNVRLMGSVAAANMTGGSDEFRSNPDAEALRLDDQGRIQSPFWEYQ